MRNLSSSVLDARAIGFDPGRLGLTIFPTEKCNFRCVYCYEEFPNQRLSDEVTASILSLLEIRSRTLSSLSIGWFGGEPLLESSRVQEISSVARELAALHGFSYVSHITTNGYLLNYPLFEDLVEAGVVSYQISLDGAEAAHNATRRVGNASGSFATIMRNLLSLRQSTKMFEVVLRLHLHHENEASLMELIQQLALDFKGEKRVRINLQRVLNYGGVRQNPLRLANHDNLLRVTETLEEAFPPEQIMLAADTLQCCYAALPNHFVVRASGTIQKCTVALYDPRNDVGELTADGTINWFNPDKGLAWSEGLFNGNLEQMQCPWKVMQRSQPRTRA